MNIRFAVFPALYILGFISSTSCTSTTSNSGLPETWTKDFTISLYSGGGMQDAATNITFTYDSCIAEYRTGGDKEKQSFALTEKMREDIFGKMKELKAEQIRTVQEGITLDKETDRLCFNTDVKEICVSQSSTQQIHEDDRSRFADAWSYLTDLTENNTN